MNCCIQVFLLSILFSQATTDYSPIILIPGYAGSQIEAKLTKKPRVPHMFCRRTTNHFFNLWYNLALITPVAFDCWADNMRMVYNETNHSTRNVEGVETRIPQFGDPFPVEHLNPMKLESGKYFADLADALVARRGYIRNVNLRGAPYDFRRAPNDNRQWFDDMKSLTEETYIITGRKRVILIAHSMGGLMALQFLQEQNKFWKRKFVAALISLAGAYGGTAKAVRVYTIGDNLGYGLVNGLQQRELQKTWSSLAYLMPSPMLWNANEAFVMTNNNMFTVANIPDLFADLDCSDCYNMWKDTKPFKDRLAAPGVDVYCLHGIGIPTFETVIVNTHQSLASTPPQRVNVRYGAGDGTVNLRSLQACLRWNGTQPQKFFHQEFPNIDHTEILSDEAMIQNIISIIEKIE